MSEEQQRESAEQPAEPELEGGGEGCDSAATITGVAPMAPVGVCESGVPAPMLNMATPQRDACQQFGVVPDNAHDPVCALLLSGSAHAKYLETS
eukprot:SAG31_NODE_5464_length_2523_cov_1.643152_2_plen_94_part_00